MVEQELILGGLDVAFDQGPSISLVLPICKIRSPPWLKQDPAAKVPGEVYLPVLESARTCLKTSVQYCLAFDSPSIRALFSSTS